MQVFTIGYEGLEVAAFMQLLATHGIETVVDVRELPLSRKRGFSKNALAAFLRDGGRGYVHMAKLGCPKAVRNQYRSDGDWARYSRGFLKHLRAQVVAIADLADRAADSKCALLCFEADHNFCHRSMVADAIKDHCGAQISHIGAATAKKVKPADQPQVLCA